MIYFGNCGGRTEGNIINGLDPELHGPLAYVRLQEFKHLGIPDSSENITGGIGLEELVNLCEFVHRGELLMLVQIR